MENFLHVATILKPQGIRGEVKVLPETDTPSDLAKYKIVQIDGKEYKVLKFRQCQNVAYLTLSGIFDRNSAELLRGKQILVDRKNAPKLDENTYFIVDLIGCKVVANDEILGYVEDVQSSTSDIYVLQNEGGRVAFINAPGVILSVDTNEKVIVVDKQRFDETSLDY